MSNKDRNTLMKTKVFYILPLLAAVFMPLSAAPAAKALPLYNANTHKSKFNQLLNIAKERNTEKLLAEVETYLADKRFNGSMVYCCQVIKAGFAANGDAAKLKLPAPPADLDNNARESAIYNAAKIFMAFYQDQIARKLTEAKLKTPPVFECAVVENAPADVTAWRQTEGIRFADGFEKYNAKAAALLINDVNTVRDTSMVKKDATACPVRFSVMADRIGLHIYMEYKTAKADEIFAGIVNGGMYEMYIQPGHGEFYYQWLYYTSPEKFRSIDWTNQSPDYRPLDQHIKYTSVKTPDGISTLFTIHWSALYDRLPDSKTEWKLGVIPWVAEGGFTWGTGQVHELNKFGAIKFPGIEKIMPAIKRQLVMKAWAKYKKDSVNILAFWRDPVRGDTKFMAEKLQVLVTRLNDAGKEVKSDMTDETVEKLFKESVADWNEFSFRVDQLRNDWLTESLINGK